MIKKDVFFVLLRVWDKEKILSSHEELNPWPSYSALWCSTTEPELEQKIWKSKVWLLWYNHGYLMHALMLYHWAGIGAQDLKVWGSIPHGDSELFLCPTLVTRRKTSFSISSLSSKLTISLILFTSWMILAFWLVLAYDLLETDA